MGYLIFFILICVALFFIRRFLNKFKFPKISSLSVFTGPIKVGKTGVSLACAKSEFRAVRIWWHIRKFFCKMFKKPIPEEPLFYSNIPLRNMKYCDLTLDHILRKKRFNFGSIVFVDEASLLADCYLSKSTNKNLEKLNIDLLKFFKLFGHETHCGKCIVNSQQISDLHIALRKVTSQQFFIHSTSSKFFPFVSYCKMRELIYSEDGSTVNSFNEDIEESMKTVIFRKSTFKCYDSCAYSSLTDDLETLNIEHKLTKNDSLKATYLVSFRPEFASIFNDLKNRQEEYKSEVNDEK